MLDNICKSDCLPQMPCELYTYSIGVTGYKWSVSVMVLVVIIYNLNPGFDSCRVHFFIINNYNSSYPVLIKTKY